MKELIESIAHLERFYRKNRLKLSLLKLFLLINGLLAIVYAFDYLDGKTSFKSLTSEEILFAKISVAVSLLLLMFSIPLYHFISDRTINKINWNIKSSIFHDILNRYSTTYHISFQGVLPDSDLKILNLENSFTRFAYGDDLIFGEFNSVYFRLAEIHSVQLFGKYFKGLVGTLIPENPMDDINDLISKVPIPEGHKIDCKGQTHLFNKEFQKKII